MNIKTKRLILTPVTKKYIPEIFENFTSEITVYMFPSPAKNIEETEKFVEFMMQQRADKKEYVYAITKKDTAEFVGLVGLHGLNNKSPELGIWTKSASHGNHYGREAIGGLVEFAKEQGYKSLIYPVDRKNISSKKIPIYYGGKIITEQFIQTTPDGRTLEEEIYMISLD